MSSDENIVEVNENGRATAVAVGSATITALTEGVAGQLRSDPVTVAVQQNRYLHPETRAELIRINVSPPQPTAPLGDELALTALGIYAEGEPIDLTTNEFLTWVIESDGLAPIEPIADRPGVERLQRDKPWSQLVFLTSRANLWSRQSQTPMSAFSRFVRKWSPTWLDNPSV